MKCSPRTLFAISAMVATLSAGYAGWHQVFVSQTSELSCSARAIMRFDGMQHENVNGTLHLRFRATGKGTMILEGYTHSDQGSRYLQRYVVFDYSVLSISPTERHFRISQWQASASSIDESPDVIVDYFMREMSDGHDSLFLNAQKLNEKAVLLSSINSPLFICTLKSNSQLL